jgi:integration host factor subunit beta
MNKKSITKSELIGRLSKKLPGLSLGDVKFAVHIMLEHMSQTISIGERLEFRGFGSFSLHYHPPRRGRNPATNEVIVVPGKYRPHFKPAKELREGVNNKRK